MNKLPKIVAVATLCCASGITAASDRSLAIAWTGAGESIAKLTSTRASSEPATSAVSRIVKWFAPRDDARSSSLSTLLRDPDASASKGGACPTCPEPPC